MPGDQPAGTAGQHAMAQAGPAPSSPLAAVTWPVCSARLRLRAPARGDAEATWEYRRLEAVGHWLTSAPATFEEYHAVFTHPSRWENTILVELDGAVIGDLMVAVEDAWAQTEIAERARGVQAELGWVFSPDHTGRGYATEAVRELIRLCFTDLGLRRVTASCFAGNEASWRLMERVGMRREAYTVRDSLHRSGTWLDGMGYSLLVDEWRSLVTPAAGNAPGQPS